MILGALEKNCFEHISMMAQEQIEVEFREEIHAITANATNGAAKSRKCSRIHSFNNRLMEMSMKVEARKAALIAEMMQEFKDEENKIMGQFGNDPIARLKGKRT